MAFPAMLGLTRHVIATAISFCVCLWRRRTRRLVMFLHPAMASNATQSRGAFPYKSVTIHSFCRAAGIFQRPWTCPARQSVNNLSSPAPFNRGGLRFHALLVGRRAMHALNTYVPGGNTHARILKTRITHATHTTHAWSTVFCHASPRLFSHRSGAAQGATFRHLQESF